MFYKHLALVAVAAAVSCSAQATVIDFEASGTPGGYNTLNYDIDGFVFNSTMINIDVRSIAPFPGVPAASAHSGNFVALNNSGGNGTVEFWTQGVTFAFSGLWMRDFMGASTRTVTVEGLLNGQTVATVSAQLDGANWLQIAGNPGFANVDKVVMRGADYFMVDDIEVSAHVPQVPEPQTYALLLAGLGLLGARARKRVQ